MKFQVSQRGHDEYNQSSISKQARISGVNVGGFIFKSLPTREGLDNALPTDGEQEADYYYITVLCASNTLAIRRPLRDNLV